MRELTLTPSLFTILAGLVEERTGIHYSSGDQELFSSKLASRALEAGFESALDYYYFLRYDDPGRREFDALVDALVVNETYFFREIEPLRIVCDDMLRPAVAAGRRPRVWCAAAATGEEPLTLAMLLSERGLLASVEIVASDISVRALERARIGAYGTRSMRAVGDAERKWFQPASSSVTTRETFSVPPAIAAAPLWHRVNLLDDASVRVLGTFDVILCRNVLIYFGEDTVRRVVGTLVASLRDGGRLVVGASESLLRFGTGLVCEERGGSFFYRRAPS